MQKTFSCLLENLTSTEQFAKSLANLLHGGLVIYLIGDLGAGKTTLVRGILRGLGYQGKVKSPTYTLLETYQLASFTLNHYDLYRITDPLELEFLGLRDSLNDKSVSIFEWPERAEGSLPKADLCCYIDHFDGKRSLSVTAHSSSGLQIVRALQTIAAKKTRNTK